MISDKEDGLEALEVLEEDDGLVERASRPRNSGRFMISSFLQGTRVDGLFRPSILFFFLHFSKCGS